MNNKKRLIVIIGIVIAISVVMILIGTTFYQKNNDDNTEDITASTAFFIKNENNLYALFDENGKKITDFIFSDVEEFCNNVAKVENADGEKAIIKTNGKYIADFGEYDNIYQWGAIFKVYTKDREYKIINNEGKVIFNGNYDIATYNYQYYAYTVSNKEEINIVDFKGNIIDTYIKSSQDDMIYDLHSDGNYVIVIYKNKAQLYSIDDNKKILEIEKDENESLKHKNSYFEISKEHNVFVVSPFSDKYYIYKDNKLKFTLSYDKCNGFFEFFKNGLAYKEKGSGATDYILVDYDGNQIAKGVIEMSDTYNYITYESPKKITFYQNNKETKTLDVYSTQVSTISGKYHNNHVLVTDNKGKYTLYTLSGEKINETPYYAASLFSNQGYAMVSPNKNEVYLIDKNKNKVSETYTNIKSVQLQDTITYQDNLWIASKDGINYLLSNDGKVILSGFENVSKMPILDDKIIIEYKDSTKIYNTKLNKVILELNVKRSKVELEKNYAYIKEDGIISYYSYTNGSKFYSKNT